MILEKKVGYKQTKLGLIPEDWNIKSLDELGEFSKGKGIAKKDILEDKINGLSCVRYAEIYTVYHYNTTSLKSKINQESAKNSNPINYGDILFAGSGETLKDIGKSIAYLGKQTAYAGGDIIVLKQENQDSRYLGYLFNNDVVKNQLFKIGQGHSVVHIYSSGLKKILIPLPPLPEQQKIANILNTWDKAIATQEKLIAEKQKLKKGLMQQLLTGKKRFAGFINEWEEKSFKDITKINQGLQIPISKRHIENIPNSFFYITNEFLKKNSNYKYYILNPSESVKCSEDDILMTRTGNTGMVVTGVKGVFHNNFFKIAYQKNRINKDFLFYILNSDRIQHTIKKLAGTSTIPDLNHSEFYGITIKLPNLKEQQKISDTLKNCDLELSSLKLKKEELCRLKLGLMQQLLTGEKRVKI